MREAVEEACAADPYAPEPVSTPVPSTEQTPAEIAIVPVAESDRSEWSRPYRALGWEKPYELKDTLSTAAGLPGVDLHDPAAKAVVAEVAHHIITMEGPIEEDVLIGRVRSAWLLDRSGQIVQSSVRDALSRLRKKNKAVRSGTVWDLPAREVTFARTPTPDFDRKKVSQVPSAERRIALFGILSESPGMRREELARETARFFGWLRLGPDIKAAFDQDIEELIGGGLVTSGSSGLLPVEGSAG